MGKDRFGGSDSNGKTMWIEIVLVSVAMIVIVIAWIWKLRLEEEQDDEDLRQMGGESLGQARKSRGLYQRSMAFEWIYSPSML